ncbi:MAG: hypothetical protein Q9184_005123, partial [Pyrenodesmia sp. 2 TL-2023]
IGRMAPDEVRLDQDTQRAKVQLVISSTSGGASPPSTTNHPHSNFHQSKSHIRKHGFVPAPKPKGHFGHHHLLSPTAGARDTPLCLGAMNFDTAWEQFLGKCVKETSFGMLDFFYDNGGNFIDTANRYQGGESAIWIGE